MYSDEYWEQLGRDSYLTENLIREYSSKSWQKLYSKSKREFKIMMTLYQSVCKIRSDLEELYFNDGGDNRGGMRVFYGLNHLEVNWQIRHEEFQRRINIYLNSIDLEKLGFVKSGEKYVKLLARYLKTAFESNEKLSQLGM